MGIRLEYILFLFIGFIVWITATVELTGKSTLHKNTNKELEFVKTTFLEVNDKKMLSKSYSTYGVRKNGVLTLDNVRYETNQIEKLLADKGVYKENILYLDGNVSLKEKKGFFYTTEHANYNQKTEVLYITSPFVAYINQNIIHGDSLVYYTLKEEVNATKIDAVLYTGKK